MGGLEFGSNLQACSDIATANPAQSAVALPLAAKKKRLRKNKTTKKTNLPNIILDYLQKGNQWCCSGLKLYEIIIN